MEYKVIDIQFDYAPGEEVLGIVEANSSDDAKIKILKDKFGFAMMFGSKFMDDPDFHHVTDHMKAIPNK